MNLTPRDKVLVMVIPALLIVLVYGFVVNNPYFSWTKQAEVSRLQRNLDAAVKSAPSDQALMEKKVRAAELTPKVRRLEASVREQQQRWDSLSGQCSDPAKRNERREKLTTLLASNHVG